MHLSLLHYTIATSSIIASSSCTHSKHFLPDKCVINSTKSYISHVPDIRYPSVLIGHVVITVLITNCKLGHHLVH